MASFASYRRSGWVRFLVLILCALFIAATLGAPPAQALGVESVAVFGLASVLSAATAALGFKLSSNEQGQATLQKMVQDFKTVAWATGFVLVGSKLNGLQNGMDYIKMQVQNGKTYLDSRVFAWVQQWLAENGVYNSGSSTVHDYSVGETVSSLSNSRDVFTYFYNKCYSDINKNVISDYNKYFLASYEIALEKAKSLDSSVDEFSYVTLGCQNGWFTDYSFYPNYSPVGSIYQKGNDLVQDFNASSRVNVTVGNSEIYRSSVDTFDFGSLVVNNNGYRFSNYNRDLDMWSSVNLVTTSNNTGLSGTDTLGKDVVDLTLDQVLQKLKEWAQDWFDAGADSATNAATGALDLPLTVSAGAATANPSIAEDGPLVWFPSFGVPVPTLRTGETDTKTVDQGKENASAAETSTVDVAENQSVIDSLVNWALSYISPDTGLFSKFPLCVPYDAYLLVTSSLGVGAVDSDSIFGASPGDLEGVVSQDIETYSDFQPIINIKHDFELDGVTYPLDVTIDLTPWQPFVTFFREGMALLLVAELIGSEFKRIRGH